MDAMFRSGLSLILHNNGGIIVSKRRGLTTLVLSLTVASLVRALRTFRTIELACRAGDGANAHVLGRSLYETMVLIHFLLQRDSHRRALMYLAYLSHQKRKMLNSWKDTPGLKRWPTKALNAQVDAQLKAVEAQIGGALVAQVKRHWSGTRSLNEAARTLNRGTRKAYEIFYRFSSRHAHPEDPGQYARPEKGGVGMTLSLDADLELVGQAMDSSCALMWGILSRINVRLGCGHDQAIAQHKPPYP